MSQVLIMEYSRSVPFKRPKKSKKSKFTAKEDQKLRELVGIYGENSWGVISQKMGNRTTRQCRDRWNNYMNPQLSHAEWSGYEDNILLKKHAEIGPHWHIIAQNFPNRSINSVRNRFVKLQKALMNQNYGLNFSSAYSISYNYADYRSRFQNNFYNYPNSFPPQTPSYSTQSTSTNVPIPDNKKQKMPTIKQKPAQDIVNSNSYESEKVPMDIHRTKDGSDNFIDIFSNPLDDLDFSPKCENN